MMFNNAIEQALAAKDKALTEIVKLGTVSSITGGRARIQHYGESTPSGKDYVFIEGYYPQVGDKVAMLPQANTYIILGKVSDSSPIQYITKAEADDDYLPVEYANKLQDGDDNNGKKITLSSTVLTPAANNTYDIGSSSYQFSKVYSKEFYLDGVAISQDTIFVKSGGVTYSLTLTVSGGTAILTPSSDNVFALGSSSKKFKEAYLGLFRGSWKSGQSTERQISWNSSNALVPDTNNSVDLGSSSLTFGNAFVSRLIGALAYSASSGNISWTSATVFAPSANNSIELGSSSKQFNAVYTNKLYLNGTEFNPSGMTVDALTTKYGSTNYTLTLSVKNGGSSSQYEELAPSVNNNFSLGNSSRKFQTLYLSNWHNGTRYISFDTSHNILPDTTNAVSLGTSNKQYKNIYGQNIYVNGTAVSSDRRIKKDIKLLDERYEKFFSLLNPSGFKYINGESGRTHTGFIAQEVEEAAKEAGLSEEDLAVVVIDSEGRYYLRYEELVAVQAQVIQKMQHKVDSLEARIAKLEALLERSMDK